MSAYVYIDVSRKQEYIYRQNKLRENLLNSCVIKAVTENLQGDAEQEETAKQLPLSLNGFLDRRYKGRYVFEFSGGGNSIVRFDEGESLAAHFVRAYSTESLRHYPELELYMSIVDIADTDRDVMTDMEVRKRLIQKADSLKDKRRAAFRRWTYGIEQLDETGKALREDLISQTDRMNHESIKLAKAMIAGKLNKKLDNEAVRYTDELQDYYKRENGKSYIGVIAIDGNRMGEMVNRLRSFEELRTFSAIIEQLYLEAVTDAIALFASMKEKDPFLYTPIVIAGDDVCIIVEGEYAIELAAQIVHNIEQLSKSSEYREQLEELECTSGLSACAGVTIVKVAYPFYEAVKSAESLCHRAKEAMHSIVPSSEMNKSASFIDWMIVEGQVMADSNYDNNVQHLNTKERYHIKPLRIDQAFPYADGVISYWAFEKMVRQIKALPHKNSFLEQIKKVQYGGWVLYKRLFEMNRMDVSKNIQQLVQSIFAEAAAVQVENAALVENNGSYTYVLNDVLEAMDFMSGKGDDHAASAVSNSSSFAQ
ncbi:Cas10/Cmr2 second palm domain-containing protein [Cohnella hongkongensis]|uniref:Cas10/Cmr2 second palm domain-containing protein n=1 Tax=Cohnella hongkongensis TaxID=178337 RepID=A0ABV9FIB7_9BACL